MSMNKQQEYYEVNKYCTLTAALGVAFTLSACNAYNPDKEEGIEYLQDAGYTNVSDGEDWTYFNLCLLKNVPSPDYNITTPDGKGNVIKTVCFSPFGLYDRPFKADDESVSLPRKQPGRTHG
jgi:hypothetical protein